MDTLYNNTLTFGSHSFILLIFFILQRFQVGKDCFLVVTIPIGVIEEVLLDLRDFAFVPGFEELLTEQPFFDHIIQDRWKKFREIFLFVGLQEEILNIKQSLQLSIDLDKPE